MSGIGAKGFVSDRRFAPQVKSSGSPSPLPRMTQKTQIKIDPRIRKAGGIALALRVLASIASAGWDHWMDGTQGWMARSRT